MCPLFRVSVYQSRACPHDTITRDTFKLRSPNLDQRCKTPWLRCLLFFFFFVFFFFVCVCVCVGGGGVSTLTFKVKFNSKVQTSLFWVCLHHNSSPIQARIITFGPKVQNTFVKIPIIFLGWLTLTFRVKLNVKDCFMGLTVSWSPSSACTYKPRLFHSPDSFTVSTLCTYNDLGSRGDFGV